MTFSTNLLVLCLLALSSFAQGAITGPTQVAAVADEKCRDDVNDAGDVGYRLSENSILYKGQCIDGLRFRPIKNFSLNKTTAVFDNYLHENRYWKAQVPVDKKEVAAVYLQILRFPVLEGVIAAHTQLRFVFKDKNAIKLTAGTQTSSSGDIVVSFEAGFPKGVNYNFALGGFANYARVSKIMSAQQKQNDNSKTALEQYKLNLSTEEVSLLLQNSLSYSYNLDMVEFYNTLRPNCTTEAFDLIDGLPSLAGKFKPFLTALSPDPIAGPTIKGLLARKLITERSQDFTDEVRGVQGSLPIPEVKNAFATFLPMPRGRDWTLVTVLPDMTGLSVDEQKALEHLRDELILTIPALVQGYGSVLLLTPDEQKGQQLFLKTLKEISQRIPSFLRSINKDLPAAPGVDVSFYFAPIAKMQGASPVTLPIPAELPFAISDYRIDNSNSRSRDIFQNVGQGILEAGQSGIEKNDKPFLMGTTILLHVEKDNSQSTTQLIVGLEKLESALSQVTPQVEIQKVVVPGTRLNRPAMIVTHEQEVNDITANPHVDVQFGAFGKLGGTSSEFGYGSLQIYKSFRNCSEQAEATPYFQGVLGSRFTGFGFGVIDSLIKGNSIRFHILRMGLNLKDLQVEGMDLVISTLGFNCIDSKDAEQKFTKSANDALTELIQKGTDNPMLQKLSPLLN